jgi:colicin import membrane protein
LARSSGFFCDAEEKIDKPSKNKAFGASNFFFGTGQDPRLSAFKSDFLVFQTTDTSGFPSAFVLPSSPNWGSGTRLDAAAGAVLPPRRGKEEPVPRFDAWEKTKVRCPSCGFVTFDDRPSCKRCGCDFQALREGRPVAKASWWDRRKLEREAAGAEPKRRPTPPAEDLSTRRERRKAENALLAEERRLRETSTRLQREVAEAGGADQTALRRALAEVEAEKAALGRRMAEFEAEQKRREAELRETLEKEKRAARAELLQTQFLKEQMGCELKEAIETRERLTAELAAAQRSREEQVRELRRAAAEKERVEAEKMRAEAEKARAEAALRVAKREAEGAVRQAADEAKRLAAEEAKRRAAEDAKRQAVEEAKRKAAEVLNRLALEDAKNKAVEEAKRTAAEMANRAAAEAARRKAVEQAERLEAEKRKRLEAEETKRQAVEEARKQAAEAAVREAAVETRKIIAAEFSKADVLRGMAKRELSRRQPGPERPEKPPPPVEPMVTRATAKDVLTVLGQPRERREPRRAPISPPAATAPTAAVPPPVVAPPPAAVEAGAPIVEEFDAGDDGELIEEIEAGEESESVGDGDAWGDEEDARAAPAAAGDEPEIAAKGGLIFRTLAGGIDLALLLLVVGLFLAIGRLVAGGQAATFWKMIVALGLPFYILFVLLSAAYFSYMHGAYGQTVGKRLLGLKVLTTHGEDIGYLTAFLRFVSTCFALGCLGMGVVWLALDPNKQGWHDKLARTVIVRL